MTQSGCPPLRCLAVARWKWGKAGSGSISPLFSGVSGLGKSTGSTESGYGEKLGVPPFQCPQLTRPHLDISVGTSGGMSTPFPQTL